MLCSSVAARIESLHPEASPSDVARLALLMCNHVGSDLAHIESDDEFDHLWHAMGIRLQAATDQHHAMTSELSDLANSALTKFDTPHVWTLIRALKVQAQVMQLYVGEDPPLTDADPSALG